MRGRREKEEICQGRGKIRQNIETKGMMRGKVWSFDWKIDGWRQKRKKSEGGRDRPHAETPPQLEFEHFLFERRTNNNKQYTEERSDILLQIVLTNAHAFCRALKSPWRWVVEPTEIWWGWIDEIFGGGLERGCGGDSRCSDKDNSPRASVPKEKCRLWGWQAAPGLDRTGQSRLPLASYPLRKQTCQSDTSAFPDSQVQDLIVQFYSTGFLFNSKSADELTGCGMIVLPGV